MNKSALAEVATLNGGVTPAQRLRRQRILDATVELATQGGFDAVQMREVAERADVALGTLYRYFPSKIHLLVSAMAEQMHQVRERLAARPFEHAEPSARVMHVLRRVTRAMQRNRNMSDAMVRALMFGDASVAAEVDAVSAVMTSMISDALYGVGHEPSERDAAIARIIGKVWLADILSWLSGRTSADDMWADLELATQMVVACT